MTWDMPVCLRRVSGFSQLFVGINRSSVARTELRQMGPSSPKPSAFPIIQRSELMEPNIPAHHHDHNHNSCLCPRPPARRVLALLKAAPDSETFESSPPGYFTWRCLNMRMTLLRLRQHLRPAKEAGHAR